MEANHLIPVQDQYHLKFKLFRETETVWTDEDANPDVPVNVALEFVSELDVTLSHADLLLLLLSEESHTTKSYSISLMADALATMEIPESKHKHIIRFFLAHFKAKQSESPPHVVDLVITKNNKQSGKRPRFDMERGPYVCVTVARYKSELAAGRRLGLEIRGETTCAICREEFDDGTDGDRLVHLDMPCSHIFHVKCIDKWLETCQTTRRSHWSCPLCRFPLPRRFDHQLVFM